MSKRRVRGLPLLLVLLSLTLTVGEALNGEVVGALLSGTVTDSSGAAVPNAKISVMNIGTGVVREVRTDTLGFSTVPNLPAGSYDITTSAPSFTTLVRRGIILTVGASQVLDVALQVGQVSQKSWSQAKLQLWSSRPLPSVQEQNGVR